MAVSEYGSERSGVGSLAGACTRGAAADGAEILAAAVGGPLPIGIRCWDGSTAGATDAPATIVLRDPRAPSGGCSGHRASWAWCVPRSPAT